VRIALNALYVGTGVAGGRVYMEGLLRGFAALDDDTRFTVFVRRGIAVPALPDRFEVVHAPVAPNSTVWRTLWEYLFYPQRLRHGGFDVLHGLGSVSPSPPRGVKFVLTVHDLIHRHFPASLPLGHRLFTRFVQPRVARRADLVIVPSRTSHNDAVRFLRVDAGQIRTVPYGPGNPFRVIDDRTAIDGALAKFGIRAPYVLSVARGYPHKNLGGLLRAFAQLPRYGAPDARLVLVGDRYLVGMGLDALIDALGIRDRVTFTGFATNDELNALYSGATVFAFPSLAEGLGLPVAEAMACGVPVVASSASAVPEAVGDAGVLADATDPAAFASALASVLLDEARRADLRARGLKRAGGFTWERCAAETLAVYRELA
jgi:glycosyltransferase involved in cell wall biosynthesis